MNLASTNYTFSCLLVSPGCFPSSPNQPNPHLLMFFLVTALGKHEQYLTAFSSITTSPSWGQTQVLYFPACHQLLSCLILHFSKSHRGTETDSNRKGMCNPLGQSLPAYTLYSGLDGIEVSINVEYKENKTSLLPAAAQIISLCTRVLPSSLCQWCSGILLMSQNTTRTNCEVSEEICFLFLEVKMPYSS